MLTSCVSEQSFILQTESRRITHISAEQKRRFNIKIGFDTLHSLVTTMSSQPSIKVLLGWVASAQHTQSKKTHGTAFKPNHLKSNLFQSATSVTSATPAKLGVGVWSPSDSPCRPYQISKATTLQKTAEYISKMQQDRSQLHDEAQRLREEILLLNSAIK